METRRNDIVLDKQIRLLYDHLPFILWGNIIASSGLAIVLQSVGQHGIPLAWAGAVYLLSFARLLVLRAFLNNRTRFDTRAWARIFVLLSGTSGSLWGLGGVLLFQQQPLVLIILVVVLAGMTSGSVSAHSSYLPAYVAYAVPAITPFSLRCIAELDTFYVTVGVLTLTFLMVNINYGRNFQRTLVESIRLRFQNIALVEELTYQKEVAEKSNLAKTRFLAAASHDLRQPVQAIELFVDALEHDLGNHPGRPLVGRIRTAVDGVGKLLSALLDFSKIDAAIIVPEKNRFPLASIFEHLQVDYVHQAAARGISLAFVPTSVWVHTDPALLERILRNFATNAVKYTPHGRILFGCRRIADGIRIDVVDTGIGIPEHEQKDIFKEFYQIGNPERDREKGLGLGLYIAEGLAHALGHPLELKSVPGKGSRFSITVPRCPSGLAQAPAVPHDVPNGVAGKTVLLIDDDATICAAATEMLDRWDCATVTAESANEAIELMKASGFEPDVIIADYRLRASHTGVEAIRAIQAHCGNLPAAILTGDTAPDRLREAQESGLPLLHKPLTAPKLLKLLASLLHA